VLYECLTGERAFEGETVSDTIAKILERDVDWGKLPKSTPPRIRELLRRCFEKDARKRLRDIGEARLALEAVRAGESGAYVAGAGADTGTARRPPTTLIGRAQEAMRTHGFLFALGLIMGALLALNMFGPLRSDRSSAIRGVVRASIAIPPDLRVLAAELSPDGRVDVVRAVTRAKPGSAEGRPMLYKRRLDSQSFEPIAGTEGALFDFLFSPDNRWIAYSAPVSERSAKVRIFKVPVDGSAPPVPIMDWSDDWDGGPTWLASGDFLVVTNHSNEFVRLAPIGAAAPKTKKFAGPEYAGTRQFGPVLPGDRSALMTLQFYEGGLFRLAVGAVDLETGKWKVLVRDAGSPHSTPTGHLVFTRKDALYAVRFDPRKLEVRGEPIAIMNGLRTGNSWGNAAIDLSSNGILQSVSGGSQWANRRAVIVDARGTRTEWAADREAFEAAISVSPDGNRFAAVTASTSTLYEILISDRGRPGARRAVALKGADAAWPLWSPDGASIAYGQQSISKENGIYIVDLAGGAPPRRIVRAAPNQWMVPSSWSPDRSHLLCETTQLTPPKLFVAAVSPSATADVEAKPLFQDNAQRGHGSFSPDGKWITYQSDETGKPEVYVCAWAGQGIAGEPTLVSVDGGENPRWGPDGRRLYYVSNQEKLMSVTITTTPQLKASVPVEAWDLAALGVADNLFDILPDGRLLAIQKGEGEGEITRFDLTLNFFDELKQRFAAKK
jgi:serine/threonine-protein kinase